MGSLNQHCYHEIQDRNALLEYTPAAQAHETPSHLSYGLFPAFRDAGLSGSRPKQDGSPQPMPTYGYARVSSLDQDLAIQRAALKAAGAGVVRAETASGSRRDGLTELQVLPATDRLSAARGSTPSR